MMLLSRHIWWTLIIILSFIFSACPLLCKIGIGQRGRMYENGIGWTRQCPKAKYCFEVVTTDIKKAKKLFDYPWDSYYDTFYVRSCGGDYGTNYTWHPYKALPKATRHNLGMVKINITTPQLITGEGGPKNKVEMMLRYKCKTNLCEKIISAGTNSHQFHHIFPAILSAGVIIVSHLLFV